MDDPWADTPSPSKMVIPPRPPKADRRSIPIPSPKVVEPEQEEEEVKADETPEEIIVSAKTELQQESGIDLGGFDDFDGNRDEDQVEIEKDEQDGDGDGFDDFDDFDAPAGPSTIGEDGGFGDFGDFEEGDFVEPSNTNGDGNEDVHDEVVPEVPRNQWSALNLRPFPTHSELLDQLSEILSPLIPPTESLGDAPVRSVGGLGQVMYAESSRDAYAQLTTAPILKPLDWTRSRVRREHLISMGVPVNLDEVDSHRISSLPPLRITTTSEHRSTSLDIHNSKRSSSRDKGKGREEGPQSAAPEIGSNGNQSGDRGKYGLGSKPGLDIEKAEELCGLEEDRLSILPLTSLRKIQDEIVKTSAQASATLAWGLQFKDAQSQDSATYNGMISELISNAAKAKSAQQTGSGGVFRRSSQKAPVRSGSGTPRVGSPANR